MYNKLVSHMEKEFGKLRNEDKGTDVRKRRNGLNEANNGPSDADVQEMAWKLYQMHWNALGTEEQNEVYRKLGYPELAESKKTKNQIRNQIKDLRGELKAFRKAGDKDRVEDLKNEIDELESKMANIKESIKESIINEGQFSWLLPNGEPIYSTLGHQKTVYMLDDKGNKWKEDEYEGYGEFGGKDFYVLLAEMNGITGGDEEELRSKGIDLAFPDSPHGSGVDAPGVKYPRFTDNPNLTYNQLPNPKDDPNQGWYQEEEDDDEYWREDEDESVKEDQRLQAYQCKCGYSTRGGEAYEPFTCKKCGSEMFRAGEEPDRLGKPEGKSVDEDQDDDGYESKKPESDYENLDDENTLGGTTGIDAKLDVHKPPRVKEDQVADDDITDIPDDTDTPIEEDDSGLRVKRHLEQVVSLLGEAEESAMASNYVGRYSIEKIGQIRRMVEELIELKSEDDDYMRRDVEPGGMPNNEIGG